MGCITINANGVGTSFIGHGYYASSREVLSDIELMLKHGIAPRRKNATAGTGDEGLWAQVLVVSRNTSASKMTYFDTPGNRNGATVNT
jgi:hypothetical protein